VATVVADLVARLRADTAQFGSAMKGAQAQTTQTATSMKSSMLGMGKTVAAGFAVYAGINFFKGAISEAEEAQRVQAQTAAVIKSTGGAAGVSAQAVRRYSDALSRKAAVDNEVIQSGANMLLTFKNINSEIFQRSLTAATDLAAGYAAASGGTVDLKAATLQLGKALNDPIAGMTALTRVGVQFTESQKDQIKTLVESGNTLAAQKIILKEVESQFAGSAAANVTASARLKVAWAEIKESVGKSLLPFLQSLADALVPIAGFFAKNTELTYVFIAALLAMLGPVGQVVAALVALHGILKAVGLAGGPSFAERVAAFKAKHPTVTGGGGGFKFKQWGGPVSSGQTYMVGEQGPELFTPSSSGYIVPNHRLGAGGGGVMVVVQGSVISERRLVDVITEAQRKNTRQGR